MGGVGGRPVGKLVTSKRRTFVQRPEKKKGAAPPPPSRSGETAFRTEEAAVAKAAQAQQCRRNHQEASLAGEA